MIIPNDLPVMKRIEVLKIRFVLHTLLSAGMRNDKFRVVLLAPKKYSSISLNLNYFNSFHYWELWLFIVFITCRTFFYPMCERLYIYVCIRLDYAYRHKATQRNDNPVLEASRVVSQTH